MEEQRICTVVFHGLSRADAQRLVRFARTETGDYWNRRATITPTATDWVIEERSGETAEDWGRIYGPWSEHNAFMFTSYWNRHCGWIRYRATPVMTDNTPPERGYRQTGAYNSSLY